MSEPTQPEQAIQTGAPQAAPETALQEGMPSPDIIPLPPMAPAPEQTPAPVATGWSAFDVVLFLMLGTLSFFLGSFILTNSDFWLHLATGRGLADGTHQLGVDPFSFATVRDGAPVLWVNHSWLYDLGLYGLFSAFGGRGVAIFQAALMVALFLLIVRIAGRGIRPMSAMLLAGLTLLVLSQRTLGATPMTVSLLLFGVLFLLMRRGGLLGGMTGEEKPSSWALWGLPLLFVVWVNLDGWFILGLATLALVVLGNAVVHALGGPDRCPLSTQGLILLISVVAALINPFHVRAFILPPEMAYALGKSVPVALGPGGEALRGLQEQDRDLLAGVGYVHIFHPAFFPSSAQTFSIAKAAFYVLLLLGMISFVLAAFTAREPGVPGWPFGRLLAWLLAAFLGGTQTLLIPLFAVIAGPITILNFAEFVQGRRRRAPAEPELMLLNPNLARFAVFVLVLVALALAWPGWLHSGIGERSSRRVAWHVEADPSLQAAAESLKQAGAKQVFNMNAEVAHYGAWFAPGVRFHLDQRLGLFPTEAARYARMRKQLREDASTVVFDQRRPSKTDWPGFFRAENIDHLIVTRFELGQAKTVAMMCWLQPWHWTQRHADGKTLVFAWSASGQADGALLPQALNRAAFGSVPPARRAPLGGANPPQTAPSLSSIYLDAHAAFPPPSAHEPHVHHLYFELFQSRWRLAYEPVWHLAAWAAPAGLAAAAPGSCLGPFTDVYSLWMERLIFPRLMLAPDLGPPAAPLLMIRAARQALADNPNEAQAHLALYHAYKLQGTLLEDRWIGLSGRSPEPNERIHVRQLQMVMALRNYLDLRPDDWQARQWLADLFYQTHQLDAGLEQMGLVIEKLGKERRKLRDKRRHDELFATEKKLGEFHKTVERDIKRRRGDYDLETSKMEPMQKYFIAVQRPYAFLKPDNQPEHDPRGMGLTLEGLKQLQSVAVDTLPAEQKSALHVTRCQLLMQLGRLVEASDELSQVKEIPLQHLVRHFAALGDYGHMESNLAKLEEQAERELPVEHARRNLAANLAAQMRLFLLGDLPTAPRLSMLLQPFSTPALAEILLHLRQAVNEHANSRTLRGLLALEVGDTARAEEHFARALSLAGPLHFSDRPVAERYLELLRAQK